jgi:hypothetical protein
MKDIALGGIPPRVFYFSGRLTLLEEANFLAAL